MLIPCLLLVSSSSCSCNCMLVALPGRLTTTQAAVCVDLGAKRKGSTRGLCERHDTHRV